MKKYNKIIGNYGEDIASKFLEKNKYKIIERNYRCKYGEIDIITKDKNILAFVEVKSRTNQHYGLPAEAVNYYKQKKIINTAKYYVLSQKIKNTFCRFDIVEVFLSDDDNNVRLIKNAFMIK